MNVARKDAPVRIDEEALTNVKKARDHVETLVEEGKVVYGVTTGLGQLKDAAIEPEESQQLQENLLASHACGIGDPLPEDVVRAMMLLRANALLQGKSGVRPVVIEILRDVLDEGLIPLVPRKGSVGSSGDLVPLAHMAQALTGTGQMLDEHGEGLDAETTLQEAGITPLTLEAKEGLALINGTQMQTAIAALLAHDARGRLKTSLVVGAMSVEGLRGSRWPFDARLPDARPHPGAVRTAAAMETLLEDSPIMRSHANCDKVQDPYSFRCIPQVHGAVLDAIEHLATIVEREANSVTDNPLIFPEDGLVISGGNFHGEPIGLPLAYATTALAKLAAASERRTMHLLLGEDEHLPPFLTAKGGLNSGLMIPQYVAASLVNENKALAYPVVADTIPTSGNQEDVNAMGATQALHARRVLDNLTTVLAIEALTAAQAIDHHAPDEPGKGARAAHARLRETIPHLDQDRTLKPDIDQAHRLIQHGHLTRAAENATETLIQDHTQ